MATAKQVLAIIQAELGTKESPAGSNKVKYNTWFYGREVSGSDYSWCMVFVQWAFAQAGLSLPLRTASCGALMRAAQEAGCWVTGNYKPGDVVIYDFPGGAATDHCGIVESATASVIVAIEGNTGSTSDADGGQVQRRDRPNKYIKGAVRSPFDAETEEDDDMVYYAKLADVPDKFRPTIDKLMTAGIIQGDGSDATGNRDVINLSHDTVRTLVFVYRGGGFDRQLQAAGLTPAV